MLLTRPPLLFQLSASTREEKAFDLHVLGTPPAFVLSQDQTLIIKVRTIFRLLSSICLLAYCLLVKNVCCLELNQDALHLVRLFFVQFSKVYVTSQQLLYLNKLSFECQELFEKVFKLFRSVVVVCCDNFYILSLSQLFVNNFLKLFVIL